MNTPMTRNASLRGRVFLITLALVSTILFSPSLRSGLTQAPPSDAAAHEIVDGRRAAAGRVIVKFRPGADVAGARRRADASDVRPVGGAGAVLLRSRSLGAADLTRLMAARPDVEYAEPDYVVEADAATGDPYFTQLWGLRNTGQTVNGAAGTAGADIGAATAWDLTTGGAASVVAVVDTGVDYTHPDLAANIWSAPAAFTVQIAGQTIECPQGSHGFNAITLACDPMDDNNHGTHVAGTVGAVGDNGVGVAGVSQTASVMGAKFLNSSGSGAISDAINAIEFTLQAKKFFAASGGANVRVLNNSWSGGSFSQALLDQINRANAEDMLFVAAAGNNGRDIDASPAYPASYNAPNVIAVASTNSSDQLATSSNRGAATVALAAPGVNIYSTLRGATYGFKSGTSMAAPHVAGAAALVLSRCALDTAGLKSSLLNNVDAVEGLAPYTSTGGRLNAYRAVSACAPAEPDFSLSASPASVSVAAGSQNNSTVAVTPSGGFGGDVTFTVAGLPEGASASFSPASVNTSGATTLTLSAGAGTAPGTYTLSVTGTGGDRQNTAAVTLTVTNPDFALSATPSAQTVNAGGQAAYTVSVTGSGGFSGDVVLNVSGLPAGASASFSPTVINTSGSSSLTVTTGPATPAGTYALTVSGEGGGLRRTSDVTLTVNNPSMTVTASTSAQTVSAGGRADYTVNVTSSGGFAADVTFGVTGLPAGASASFSPAVVNTSGSTIMTVATDAATPAGTYTLSVTGSGGSLESTTSVTLTVVRPDFTLSATPASQTVRRGGNVSYTVSVAGSGGFGGDVALSVTGLPAGATASFGPATVTGSGSSVLTVWTASTSPKGTYTLTITGASGAMQRKASVSLTLSGK